MAPVIPVVLFTYNRPDHLRRTLDCLRENQVPLIYAFSDGPKTPEVAARVSEVRRILREIDWCEVNLVERTENLGLGKSILTGVSEVLQKHMAIIVFEDDLICVPGTYQYLCTALEHYKDDPHVMSVTGWTHPLVVPKDIGDQPYFDGRAECWSWGTWARAWKGMDQDAMSLLRACGRKNVDIYRYGADLPEMARAERQKNLWAARFSYLHILNGGLCLRPPYSMVGQIGFDAEATNTKGASKWSLGELEALPPIPQTWPEVVENPECPGLWQRECGARPSARSGLARRALGKLKRWLAQTKKDKQSL
jgi:hypothetical protein